MKVAETSEFCDFLASVYESQSCQNYLPTQDCSNKVIYSICTLVLSANFTRKQATTKINYARHLYVHIIMNQLN